MRIELNGENREVPEGLSAESLIDHLNLTGQSLLIEHNGVALFKSDWPTTAIRPEDRLELIRIVAGG